MPNQPKEIYNAVRLTNWEAINCASLEGFEEFYYDEGEGFITGFYNEWAKGHDPNRKIACLEETCGHDVVRKYGSHWSRNVRNLPINLDDLRWRLRKHTMIRRLKEHVLTELPPKQWHLFPLENNAKVKKVLKSKAWAEVSKLYEIDGGVFDEGMPIDGSVSTAYRELGEATAPMVADYIEEMMQEGY